MTEGMTLTIRKLHPWLRGLSSFSVGRLRPFTFCRRASVALESVAYIAFTVGMFGTVFEIVTFHNTGDILERAAYAVARDHVLQEYQARNPQELENRAWAAIRAEVGDALDSSVVDVRFEVYKNPTKMQAGDVSTDKYSQKGGAPGDMVVVKLIYEPTTGFAWLQRQLLDNGGSGEVAFAALAVTRNELALALNPDKAETVSQTGDPDSQTGDPDLQTSVPDSQTNDPNLQTSNPNTQTNDPNSQTNGGPGSQTNGPLETSQLPR